MAIRDYRPFAAIRTQLPTRVVLAGIVLLALLFTFIGWQIFLVPNRSVRLTSAEVPIRVMGTNWGIAKEGDNEARHTITIFNDSDREIEIDRVFTSCDCLTLNLPSPCILPPHSQIQVPAQIKLSDARRFNGRLRVGCSLDFVDKSVPDYLFEVHLIVAP